MTGGMAILITCSTCRHYHPVETHKGWCTAWGTVLDDHKCPDWQASKKAVAEAFRMAQRNPRSK